MTAWNDLSEVEKAAIERGNIRFRRMMFAILVAIVVLPGIPVAYSWIQTTWTGDRWLQKATEQAHGWAADSELSLLSGTAVDPTGLADVRGRGRWRFEFRSPSREAQALTTHEPKGIPGAPPPPPSSPSCRYAYRIFSGIRGGFMTDVTQTHIDEGCGRSLPARPRCTIAQVWQRAVSLGAPQPAFASISLNTREQGRFWSFEIPDLAANAIKSAVFKTSFADDCP